MSEKFENLNKQIASFIIVSAALAAPAIADGIQFSDDKLLADASINFQAKPGFNEVIAMYAAPQIPIGEINPVPIVKPTPIGPTPIISMYAAPQIPGGEIVQPIHPVPGPPPAISMYAAPQHPIIIEPQPIPTPIMRYAAPNYFINNIEKIEKQKNSPSLNESSLNINNLKPASNINTTSSINHAAGNIKTSDFVLTDYGNVRIIEPFSHIIFK